MGDAQRRMSSSAPPCCPRKRRPSCKFSSFGSRSARRHAKSRRSSNCEQHSLREVVTFTRRRATPARTGGCSRRHGSARRAAALCANCCRCIVHRCDMMSDEAPLVTGYGASFYPQRHGYTGHTPRPPAAAPRDRGGPGRNANAERATAEAAGTGAIPPDHAYTNRVKVGARAAGPPLWPAGGRGRPRGASPHSRVSRDVR